jgi:hypothetical protein
LIVFINAGRRPADVITAETNIDMFVTFPADPSYKRATTRPSRFTLVPNMTSKIAPSLGGVPPDKLTAILANRLSLYVYGHIEYLDVGTASHSTHLCEVYIPRSKDFFLCDTYNDSN